MLQEISQYYLDSGLKIIIKEDKLSPVTSFFVWVDTGSAYENDQERGLAHVHEHMIFKGTSTLKVGEISKQIEAHGGEINAFTSHDETVYYVTISNNFVDVALNILSECMYDAIFDEDELQKELEVILEEIKRSEDLPNSCLSQMIFTNSFPDHSYGLPILGTPNTVSNFGRDDLKNFYNKWYQAKNMKLIIVGGADTEQLKEKINKSFSKLKSDNINSTILNDSFTHVGLRVDVDYREVNESYFAISFRTQKASNLKSPILDMIGVILGSGESSILNKRLKEELGLATSIYSYNASARHGGVFVVGGTLLENNLKDSLRLIIKEIRRIINLDFDSDQLERAKTELLTQNLYENETVQSQAQKIGFLESQAGTIEFEKDYLETIRKATPEKIREISKEFFKVENLALSLILPKSSEKQNPDSLKIILNESFKKELKFSTRKFRPYKLKNYSIASVKYEKPKLLKLDNGVNLLVLQNKKTPLISLRSVSLGGLKYENKTLNGKFSLLTDLLTRGSKNYSKDDIAMKTEILASELEGFSGRNSFGLKMVGPSTNLVELVSIFSDVINNPIFEDSEIDIAKKDVLSYLNRKKQNYASIVADKFLELLFGDHAYSLNQFGTEDSIRNIQRGDILEAHKNFISQDNILLSAVGNFEISQLVKELNKHLLFENDSKKLPRIDSCNLITDDRHETLTLGDKEQSHIMIGTYAPDVMSEDRFAFNIINSVLSGMGGRLFLELRDKKSLAYTVTSFFSPNFDHGYFGVYIGCSPEKKDESIEAINNQLVKLVSDGIGNHELERAKNYLIGKNDISLQRNSSINTRISQASLYGLSFNEPFNFSSHIDAVSKQLVDSTIEKYLGTKKKVTVSVDPS